MSDTVNNTLLQQIQTQIEFEHIKSKSSELSTPIPSYDEFYEIINLEGQIDGPFNVSKVANIFVSHFRDHSLFEHRLWVRPCQKDSSWYKLNVSYLKMTSDIELCLDSSFYNNCGNLIQIIEQLKKIGFYSTNSYPSELIASNNESMFHIIATIINYSLFIFGLLHINILIYFFYLIQTNASIQQKPKIVTGFCILLIFMAIITSVTVSYLFIYFGIYNSYQSWMVAYISWISIQWIEEGILRILFVCGYLKKVCEYDSFRLNMLGIQFKRKNDIIKASGWHNCWIPATFALLPASIIGFVINFIFEEEFVLECDADLLQGDICYEHKVGCCIVVSSHDFNNYDSMLDFLSVLASNIIAVYGLIRIFAWFMVSQTKQYKGMAQKVE